jgi:hypothetical protein
MNKLETTFIFIVLLGGQLQAFSQIKSDSLFRDYKIQNIERIKNGFIIDVSDVKDNTWYTIASIREKHKNYPKLEIDKIYQLKLRQSSSMNMIPNLNLIFVVELKGKTLSIKSRGWTRDVFFTENIIGKYYKFP